MYEALLNYTFYCIDFTMQEATLRCVTKVKMIKHPQTNQKDGKNCTTIVSLKVCKNLSCALVIIIMDIHVHNIVNATDWAQFLYWKDQMQLCLVLGLSDGLNNIHNHNSLRLFMNKIVDWLTIRIVISYIFYRKFTYIGKNSVC